MLRQFRALLRRLWADDSGGGLFGSNAKQPTAIGSLQFQTAQQGAPVPLVWGTTRVAPNLIEYDDFTASKSGGGKGKGGGAGKGSQGTQYNYSASIIFGLCQGPVNAIYNVWWDKNITGLSGFDPGATLYQGADGQAGDPYWQSAHANEYLNYSGTANVVANNHQLGNTATVPNTSFEVNTLIADAPNGFDANPATIVADYLVNPRYGAGFPSANLDPGMTNQASPASWWTYCMAAGIFLSPQLDQQQEAQQNLADFAGLGNAAVVWSGGLLKVIPYGDEAITAKYTNITIAGAGTGSGGSPIGVPAGDVLSLVFTNPSLAGSPVTISYTAVLNDTFDTVADDLGAYINENPTLAAWGIRAGAGSTGGITIFEQPPLGTVITQSVSGGETITIAQDGTYSFVPVTTVQYSLGEDDFIVQATMAGIHPGVAPGGPALRAGGTPVTGGFTDDPVHVQRSSPADADNMVEVEFRDRGNQYNSTIAEVFDQGAIDLYGIRRDTSLKATAVCNWITAYVVAQLRLQRALYFRNTYTFQLGWKYCLLEPMDLVAITDARLGLNAQIVRITGVEEDEEGTLTVTAEDFHPGWATVAAYYPGGAGPGPSGDVAVFYPVQGLANAFVPNWSAGAGNLNPPIIFEPPAKLLPGDLEIWIALSGSDPTWGGAQVWISSDGNSYAYAGTIDEPANMGLSTADLPNYGGANPDTGHTLAVNLSESRGQLQSVSATDAANLVTLCWLGGELLAFETATLTSAYNYNLTTLYRGAYGSTVADHPSGTQFARLDGAIGRFPYPPALVGQQIYLKFLSFNTTGGAVQTLAAATAYAYTVTGGGKPTGNLAISGFYIGDPAASQVLQRYVFAAPATLPAGLPGSQATAAAAPSTTPIVVNLYKNSGAPIGTITWAIGSAAGTFSFASSVSFAIGDELIVENGSATDPAFLSPSWTILGNQ
jgi:hypothetical protein